ncbi:hypothetical protein [Sphingomonas sp. PWP1-2]|uniref:hypothetical protein n=1 Tax=Sphingomonas sp. PWP1-2 TaxID=2804558 RepID=UPI003CF3D854
MIVSTQNPTFAGDFSARQLPPFVQTDATSFVGVEASGTHGDLLAAGGRYDELFELQAAGYR